MMRRKRMEERSRKYEEVTEGNIEKRRSKKTKRNMQPALKSRTGQT
jgi:hypothetical protein